MVMITGVSVRPPQGFLLPFCHTLVLRPVMTTTPTAVTSDPNNVHMQEVVGYQIQNDNLVFLTGDESNNGGANGAVNGARANGSAAS